MQTIIKDVGAEKILDFSEESIFEIISDHEGTDKWVNDVEKVVLLQQGMNKNGKGAIRRVKFKPKLWSTIDEEIIEYNPNQSYSYKITDGMPGLVNHLGMWQLDKVGNDKTKVTWNVHFEFKKYHWFGLLTNTFAKSFNKVQFSALESLNDYLVSKK